MMLYNSRNSLLSVGNPPYFFYGNPIDVLSNFRVSYHYTKDERSVTVYDTKKLKYENLKDLSSKTTQGYNDFLLARFGAQGASFYALEYRQIESKILISKLTNEEKVKRINNNIENIENIIKDLNDKIFEDGKPITKIIENNFLSIGELIKATVSTEEILNQINSESEKYIEFLPDDLPEDNKEEEINYPHRPPVDKFPDEPEDPKEEEKPLQPQLKPELPPDAIFIDIKSETNVILGLNDKIVLRYITNAYNTGIEFKHQNLIHVDFNTFMQESGGYEFLITSTKRIGSSYITIKAWNYDNSILEKRINVTVMEEQMSDNKYPIITEPDENGIKWIVKSEGSEPQPLYPPFFIEWKKLLYQEKQRIPASILTLQHKQEMTVNGVIVDENGKKQYAPSYKYIEDMSRDEIEALPFEILGEKERLAFYGDALGNIAFRDEIYYKPNFKAFSNLSLEEKKAIDFELLYLNHKLELYGNNQNVIIGPNGVNYYPPNYKPWTSLTPDEKYEINQSLLQQKDKEEIYDVDGNKILKTSLRVNTDRIVLSEEKGQMVGTFEVNTNASTFDFVISNPELLTGVKTGNKLIVSPNGATQDVDVAIIITAQAPGQQLSRETVHVFIDFVDDTEPIDPDDPTLPEEVKIVVSPTVMVLNENEASRFSYYVSNEKEPKIEVLDTTIADIFISKDFVTVIGKMAGKTTIVLSVYNDDKSEIVAKTEVPILIERASADEPQNVLEVNTTSMNLNIGDVKEILVQSIDENYEVKSTNEEVMIVDKNGFIVKVTALKHGLANIVFTAKKDTGETSSISIIGYVEKEQTNN